MESIENRNDNGELNGYQEWYYDDSDTLMLRGNSKNGGDVGYQEYHSKISNDKTTEYHII